MEKSEKILEIAKKYGIEIEVFVHHYAPMHKGYNSVDDIHTDRHELLTDYSIVHLDDELISDYRVVTAEEYKNTVLANCDDSELDEVELEDPYKVVILLDHDIYYSRLYAE
jgi:hypothetical protein